MPAVTLKGSVRDGGRHREVAKQRRKPRADRSRCSTWLLAGQYVLAAVVAAACTSGGSDRSAAVPTEPVSGEATCERPVGVDDYNAYDDFEGWPLPEDLVGGADLVAADLSIDDEFFRVNVRFAGDVAPELPAESDVNLTLLLVEVFADDGYWFIRAASDQEEGRLSSSWDGEPVLSPGHDETTPDVEVTVDGRWMRITVPTDAFEPPLVPQFRWELESSGMFFRENGTVFSDDKCPASGSSAQFPGDSEATS
jgi:hypothetical protein